MNKIWIIAKRELKSYFDSLLAYVLIALFLGFSGFFTWLYGSDVFFVGQASMQSFFGVAYWTLFFFVPALSMGLLAEENRSGTIELLVTKPLSDWQIVTGKFLSALVLIAIALALTLPYYITIAQLGDVDHGAILLGYLGLLLMSATYISLGVFVSSITNNMIVSFLLSLFIGIFFHLILGLIAGSTSGTLGSVLNYLSLNTHYTSISRGVIDSKDLIYFGSFIFMGLLASESVLAKRNLVD